MGLAAKRETGSEEEEAEKRRRGRERREKKGAFLGFYVSLRGNMGFLCLFQG